MVRRILQRALRALGYTVLRLRDSPQVTWLGLGRLPIGTVVDVGANAGQFARQARRVFPAATILCFEPLPGAYRQLERWAGTQGGRVHAFETALGEDEGTAEIREHLDFSPSSSLLPVTGTARQLYPFVDRQETRPVRLDSLDRLWPTLPGRDPEVLVKIDVQGYEDRVLRGSREVTARALACLVEVNLRPLYDGQPSFDAIVRLLSELGHDYAGSLSQTYAEDGSVVYCDALFLRRDRRVLADPAAP